MTVLIIHLKIHINKITGNMNEGILTEYAYIIHLPFEHVNILQYMCFVCIMPVLYKPMNGIFLHKPYESTNIFLQMAGM